MTAPATQPFPYRMVRTGQRDAQRLTFATFNITRDGAAVAEVYMLGAQCGGDGRGIYATCNRCDGTGRTSYTWVENGRCWGCTQTPGMRLVAFRGDQISAAQHGVPTFRAWCPTIR